MSNEAIYIIGSLIWFGGWMFAAWFVLYREFGWGFWKEIKLDYQAWLEETREGFDGNQQAIYN